MTPERGAYLAHALEQGLTDLGYVLGRDIMLSRRFAAPQPDKVQEVIVSLLPQIELVGRLGNNRRGGGKELGWRRADGVCGGGRTGRNWARPKSRASRRKHDRHNLRSLDRDLRQEATDFKGNRTGSQTSSSPSRAIMDLTAQNDLSEDADDRPALRLKLLRRWSWPELRCSLRIAACSKALKKLPLRRLWRCSAKAVALKQNLWLLISCVYKHRECRDKEPTCGDIPLVRERGHFISVCYQINQRHRNSSADNSVANTMRNPLSFPRNILIFIVSQSLKLSHLFLIF